MGQVLARFLDVQSPKGTTAGNLAGKIRHAIKPQSENPLPLRRVLLQDASLAPGLTGCVIGNQEGWGLSDESSFRPRLVLRFGITGHRPPRLVEDRHDTIKEQCAEIFRLAQQSLEELQPRHPDVFSSEPAQAKLVSSLAEGADVLAAEAALESGLHLSACLPFPPEVYAKDFGEEEWRRTAALIEKADSILALTDYSRGDEAGYEIAGQIVLGQSDILVAVWDGEAARGRGGTTQIIAEAVARHQPVIHVDATGGSEPELLWSGLHAAIPDRPSVDGVERADARKALPALIEALCAPPASNGQAFVRDMIDPQDKRRERVVAWPMMLGLTGARAWSKLNFTPGDAGESVRQSRDLALPFAQNGHFGTMLNGPLLKRFGRVDAHANYYALRFRSSFVSNFAMAGLAVLLALSGLLFPEAKKLLIAAELLVILLIIANTRGANRINFHARWLERRHLAERLRQLMLTATLGRLSLRDVEDGTRDPGWTSWYARASARELGLVNATFDREYLTKARDTMVALIADQAGYHRNNARAMHHANHRLHKLGDWMFSGTILACIAYLVLSLTIGTKVGIGRFGMTEIVTFLTALFPALAAALYGIRMQGDFAATSERSSVIAHRLERLKVAIEMDPLRYDRLVERSRRLSEIMLADVQQWHLHYETRPLSLPG